MARAIWTGSISFGLLNVPVRLYSAVSRKSVSFRELRASDSSRVRHKRVAEADGEEVPYDEIVKGYEITPEQYVVLTRDELEELDPKKTKAIEIQDFVDLDEIDPIYFDHPYYLGPDKGAEKAYALLVKAMTDSNKVAVARFVLRNRENLAAIRPMGKVLTMATMRFADEVVSPDELDDVFPENGRKIEKREVEMAKQLIESLSGEFDPEKYRDEYREELLSLIERKARGEEIVEAVSEEPKPTKAPDLMAALEESLAAVKGEPLAAGAKGDGAAKRKSRAKGTSPPKSKSRLFRVPIEDLPEQVEIAKQGQSRQVDVDGHRVELTNLDKVLWPETGFTKGEVIDYYARVADTILPHLHDRPLTLKRYPNGVEASSFYEKRCPKHRPEWVETAAIWSGRNEGDIDYCLCNEKATLIWIGQLAALELHPSLSLAEQIERPTVLAFDLDPGAPADILDCCRVALRLREMFSELDLECFPKTSGSKGLQVYVPLNGEITYERTKPFAHAVAQALERAEPKRVVSRMAKKLRKGKVFVDWSQNDQHKTTISVYSLRARERATVSTPVRWSEVEGALEHKDAKRLVFEASDVLDRVGEHGDLFAPVLELKQELPAT